MTLPAFCISWGLERGADVGMPERHAGLVLRSATPGDLDRVRALNEEWVHVTSPLDATALLALHDRAAHHRVAEWEGAVAAFLLAFREGTSYASPNYRWFAERYDRFLYIDRVVVSAGHQRLGLGKALYDDAIRFACESGVPRVVCELDVEPPNAPSAAFHDRLGFVEVGVQTLPTGKRVSLRELAL